MKTIFFTVAAVIIGLVLWKKFFRAKTPAEIALEEQKALNTLGDSRRSAGLAGEWPIAAVGERPYDGIPVWTPNTNQRLNQPRPDVMLFPRLIENPYETSVPYTGYMLT